MYIGLDIGTSGSKADLVDKSGKILGSGQVSYSFSRTSSGYRELDAQAVWEAAERCLYEAASGKAVEGITVSTLGEAVVPIDREGKPVGPGITGTDVRGAEELKEIEEAFSVRTLTDITGLNMSTLYSANKILWLKKHQPEIYEKAYKILTFQDYIIYRLCNEAVIDYSMASRTLLFDLNKKDWSDELLSWCGITREKLARPVPPGSVVGILKTSIAKKLSFPKSAKIVIGTHDHICNAIGCGICEAGTCANTVGTTEGLTAVLERKALTSENIEKYQIACEPFVVPGLYNTVAWNNTSGVMLKWFVNQMVQEEKPGDIVSTFAKMNKEMSKEPTNLLILPHFSGAATPYMNSESRGAILGLTLGTKRKDIYKALMEGANYELAVILDDLCKAGVRLNKIVANGGAISPELLQIKADILGIPVHTVRNKQAGTLGGAILGAVVLGEYASLKEGVQAMVAEDRIYEPDVRRNQIYREKYEVYKRIYPSIVEINRDLAKW